MQGKFKDEYIPTVIETNAKHVSILYSDKCFDGTAIIKNKVNQNVCLKCSVVFAWVLMVVGVGGVRDGDNEVRFPD